MKEVWKSIEGYEGMYEISNLGRIKSFKADKQNGKILKLKNSTSGYSKCALFKDNHPTTFTIHKLVAQAFIPNTDNKSQINHIDGNKENNRVDNLEWCTPKENMKHASKTGLIKRGRRNKRVKKNSKTKEKYIAPKGEYSKNAKKVLCVTTGEVFNCIKYASEKYGIDNSDISKCCRGKIYHAGYIDGEEAIWRYC